MQNAMNGTDAAGKGAQGTDGTLNRTARKTRIGLVVSEISGHRGPADLRVSVADIGEPASGGRPLEVTVTNVGGTSALNVTVEVTVDEVVREVTLDLVAKGDEESAEVVVPVDATGPPAAEVLSYTKP